MDALTLLILVMAVVNGPTTGDKVGGALLGIGFNLAWKWWANGPPAKDAIRTYNRVFSSGYKIPPLDGPEDGTRGVAPSGEGP
jgi:hypothetical protein